MDGGKGLSKEEGFQGRVEGTDRERMTNRDREYLYMRYDNDNTDLRIIK